MIKNETLFAPLVALMVLSACDHSVRTGTRASDKLLFDSTEIKSEIKEIIKEEIQYDYQSFPHDTIYMAKILTTGTFHSDEVWDDAAKSKWFSLFESNSGHYLSATEIIAKRVHDAIIDESDTAKTGWQIQTTSRDTSIILIQGLDFLKDRKVLRVNLSRDKIFPGDTVTFNYLGVDYRLFAIGEKKKESENSDWFEVWNYKLYLTSVKSGVTISELLVAKPNFDDQMIKIIFMGDIDGDGLLDLIIDTSRHYNASSPTLYLSEPARNQYLLKVVGMHTSVGC